VQINPSISPSPAQTACSLQAPQAPLSPPGGPAAPTALAAFAVSALRLAPAGFNRETNGHEAKANDPAAEANVPGLEANDPAAEANDPELAHYGGGWSARIGFCIGLDGGRSVLRSLYHQGPVRLQKLLWPEGPSPAHAILLHPPGAMAGGDRMELLVRAETGSGLVITTPGAGKWYRSRASAAQRLRFEVEEGACIEWMPQETLVHDGARMAAHTSWELASGARAAALDILVFGRRQSGERCTNLDLSLGSSVRVGGHLVYLDPLVLRRSTALPSIAAQLEGAAVMGGCHVSGLLWAYAPEFCAFQSAAWPRGQLAFPGGAAAVVALQESLENVFASLEAANAEHLLVGASCLPSGLVVVRAVGNDTETVRKHLQQAWSLLRPLVRGRAGVVPRIWST
jgi:urease accessory protein